MTRILAGCSPAQLFAIVEGLLRGDDAAHLTARAGFGRDDAARQEVQQSAAELGTESYARLLRAVATERQAANEAWDRRIELVWTGPERDGAGTRDTAVVVRELFQSAEEEVVVSGYALYNARPIFEPLVQRMVVRPGLQVRVFVNVGNHGASDGNEATVTEFARSFLRLHWPPGPLPELYFDPRSLAARGDARAVLHAKCVVVDRMRTFITSANITEAAQERNIELGVVINGAAFGALVAGQFAGLVDGGIVERVTLKK